MTSQSTHELLLQKLAQYKCVDAVRWLETLREIDFRLLSEEERGDILTNTLQRELNDEFSRDLETLGASECYFEKLNEARSSKEFEKKGPTPTEREPQVKENECGFSLWVILVCLLPHMMLLFSLPFWLSD
jgi:hypothetical protein